MISFTNWQTHLVEKVFHSRKPSYVGPRDRVFAFDDNGRDPHRKR